MTPEEMDETHDAVLAELKPLAPRPLRASFHLSEAQLCVNCEQVYASDAEGCPTCGSRVGFSIARVIQPQAPAPWRKA